MKIITRISGGILALSVGYFLFFGHGCKHDPLMPDGPGMPIDTINPTDTIPTDTMPTDTGMPCDPNIVYFEQQILPLLISNCTSSGCHNATDQADGVNLTTYEKVIETADVRAFNLSGSDLYEVITETDPEDRMPPLPRAPLSSAAISLISEWILQGAENESCSEGSGCNTTDVSFGTTVAPIIQTKCQGCHSGGQPSGGLSLVGYTNIRTVALSGQLYGVLVPEQGFPAMPQGGNRLPQCEIDQIKSWIDAGAMEN